MRGRPKWRYSIIDRRHHLFRSRSKDGYRSACGRVTLVRVGDQTCARPEAVFRCAICDGEEMRLFGAEESLPPSETGRERNEASEVRRLRRSLRWSGERTMADEALDAAIAVEEEGFCEEP